jgi:hypothetical protein
MILNTDHTDPVVSLERNSEGVLIAHLPAQFQAASAGHEGEGDGDKACEITAPH